MSGYQGPAERQRDGGRRNGPFSSHLRSLSHIALAVMKYKQLSTMDNGEYPPFHDRFPPPALWSQLTPAIPYQRPRQPYPERISFTCRSGEFFIVAIRPAIRA